MHTDRKNEILIRVYPCTSVAKNRNANAKKNLPLCHDAVCSIHALAQSDPIRIILVGDSTVAPNNGWGPGFCADVTPQVTCVNMAKNGRSTSSYRAEGSWDHVMEALKDNSRFHATYVMIQFGHNDQPGKEGRSTDLATEFPAEPAPLCSRGKRHRSAACPDHVPHAADFSEWQA